jgi:hypothetical protein
VSAPAINPRAGEHAAARGPWLSTPSPSRVPGVATSGPRCRPDTGHDWPITGRRCAGRLAGSAIAAARNRPAPWARSVEAGERQAILGQEHLAAGGVHDGRLVAELAQRHQGRGTARALCRHFEHEAMFTLDPRQEARLRITTAGALGDVLLAAQPRSPRRHAAGAVLQGARERRPARPGWRRASTSRVTVPPPARDRTDRRGPARCR